MYIFAYVDNKTPPDIEIIDGIKLYTGKPVINNSTGDSVKFLGWQDPAWDESGYFWTEFYNIPDVLHNNIEEHPFIFESIPDAINHAKKINLHGYILMEINIEVLKNLAPARPENSYYKPGIAIEVMNRLNS